MRCLVSLRDRPQLGFAHTQDAKDLTIFEPGYRKNALVLNRPDGRETIALGRHHDFLESGQVAVDQGSCDERRCGQREQQTHCCAHHIVFHHLPDARQDLCHVASEGLCN